MRHADLTASPCVRVCRYSSDDECLGCFRTRSEVTAWGRLSESERGSVALLAVERRERRWQERMQRRAAARATSG